MKNAIEIYQNKDGQNSVQVKIIDNSVWLSRLQLSELFDRDIKTIGKHVNNVFKEGELVKDSVVAKFATTADDGKTYQVEHYNLDVIISVGYRVKSKQGTQFRIWATQRLNDYLIKGYAINEARLIQTKHELKVLKTGIQIISRSIEEKSEESGLQWLENYSKGLTLLDDYDNERLDSKGLTMRKAKFPKKEAYQGLIDQMKLEFNSNVFGLEKDQGFESSINQITKGFANDDFYPSLEEKAATLLYLIIKNHAFTDGNKRIAAACFLMFLEQNNMLTNKDGEPIISNEALASITLFIASSNPNEMETVKKLLVSVLNRNLK
ncbi:MAG: virulence protein RhuM/Fic/DOC family protein [Flavobacteriales bacterium]|nr:virulence protein RhuM/Fic/DOC family protein [Flavobacteriales bacterium]